MRAALFSLVLILSAATITTAQAEDYSCTSVVANAERSKTDMAIAASTYFYGIFMGKACVEVDYDRAFALATKAGVGVEPFLRVLRERAANGHPRAISALERLGY